MLFVLFFAPLWNILTNFYYLVNFFFIFYIRCSQYDIPFALNLIVLGKEHTIRVLMVNATRCLNTIVEPNVLYLSFTCFKTLQIELVPVQKHIPWVKQVKSIEMISIG